MTTTTSTNPRIWAGYRAHAVNRRTGTLVVLLDGIAAGLDTEGGRWQTLCHDHSEVIAHETLATARAWLHHPDEWCETCMAPIENCQGFQGGCGSPSCLTCSRERS